MPARQYTGGGSNFYRHHSAKMTRNIGGDGPTQTHHGNNNYQSGPNGGGGGSMSRKDQERMIRERHRKEAKLDSYLADDENFPTFKAQMAGLGLQLRDIPADGNCLFRALGDQLEGHCRGHFKHRADVVAYMRGHRLDFEPFVEDDVKFDDHMRNLQKLSTHAGNDAIVAFAKLHGVNVVIHQLNGKPLLISGPPTPHSLTRQLHIAYHNGDHYSSVRQLGDNTESPADIRLQGSGSDHPDAHHHHSDSNNGLDMNGHHHSNGGVVSVHRGLEDIENEVVLATNCTDLGRVRQTLLECDYDVDASIADLLQQLELGDDATSLATVTTDSGVATDSSSGSPNSSSGRTAGHSVLKVTTSANNHNNQGHGSVNGKGHKVHFREDSFGGNSSGYGSLSSNPGGGARPKMAPVLQMSSKKLKESKKQEKKRRAEERHRQKHLNNSAVLHIPQGSDVRNVGVVDARYTHVISMPGGRLTSI